MRMPCLIATLAALPAGLVAQDACREFGRAPAVGAYSDYRLTDKQGEPVTGGARSPGSPRCPPR
jgi:hypothetical protein